MSPSQLLREALDAGPALFLILPEERKHWAGVGRVFGEWLEAMGGADRARLGSLSWAMLPWATVRDELALEGPRPDLVLVEDEVHSLQVAWPKSPPLEPGSFESVYAREDAQNLARIAGNAQAIDQVLWPLLSGLSPALTSFSGRAPLGSCWAQATGCGVILEGRDQQNRMDCGMGYVPEGSRRFLALIDDLEPS